jgi:hypothetical protein
MAIIWAHADCKQIFVGRPRDYDARQSQNFRKSVRFPFGRRKSKFFGISEDKAVELRC